MAKTSMVQREKRRLRVAKKYEAKRKQLKIAVHNMALSPDERQQAQLKLQSLPRDANPIRQRRRCQITGRPRGVYRKFGLGRSILRIVAMRGDVPGLVKSSW